MSDNFKRQFIDPTLKRKFFRKNLFHILIPCLIPLLILGSLSVILSTRYVRLDAEQNQVNMLNQFNQLIQIITAEADSLSLSFDKEPQITVKLGTLLSGTNLSYDEMEMLFYLKNTIEVPANSKPYIHSVYVYYDNDKGRFLSSREGLVDLDAAYDASWFTLYRQHPGNEEMFSAVRETKQYAFEQPKKIVTLFKKLSFGGVNKGVIAVNILPEYFSNYYQAINEMPGRSFYITDADGQTIMQSGAQGPSGALPARMPAPSAGDRIAQSVDENNHVAVKTTDRLGWHLVSVIPKRSLNQLPLTLVFTISLLSIVSFLICSLVAIWLTNRNYRQVFGIIHILESADSTLPVKRSFGQVRDIYDLIIKNIVETFVEQKYLKVQLSERKYKMKAFEFRALQSQMNPHFLYNTLNSIYWKTFRLSNSPNSATRMIELLTDILQYSLDTSKDDVTLGEEIANIRSFVEIQQMRYMDRIEVIWDHTDVYEDCGAMKFSLQPLIENSIHYGMEARERLCLKIKCRMHRSVLKVTIIDNGPGMERGKLLRLRSALAAEAELAGHVGLGNTNKRLILRYGEMHGIRVLSKAGAGTAVTVQFPQN